MMIPFLVYYISFPASKAIYRLTLPIKAQLYRASCDSVSLTEEVPLLLSGSPSQTLFLPN